MSLLHYNKVFVLAPNKFASGGPELSHQLVDYLRNKGVDASIVYVTNPDEGCKEVSGSSIPEPYQKYNIAVASAVEDISENVVIIPEAFLLAVSHYPHAQVCVWWMSVDVAIRWDNNFEDSYQLEQDKKKRRQLLRYAINDKLKDTFLWRIKCLLSGHAYIKYGIVEPSEAKITVKPRLSPRFIAKSHGNRYLCGSKQVSRSTTGILFQFKVWTLLACGVKIGRSMPYDRIHISKSRRLAY